MKNWSERKKKVMAAGLVGVLAITSASGVYAAEKTAGSSSDSSLSNAQQEKEQLETALQEAQGMITELQNSQEDAETKIAELDQKMSDISDQMTGLEQKLDE